MYAVIRDGGRQFTVREGDRILVDRKDLQADAEIRFEQVLLLGDENGAKLGKPTVSGASVTGRVLGERLGEKLVVFKFRRRKNYVRRNGHRQDYTAVKIAEIQG